jgi:hypothetical protein
MHAASAIQAGRFDVADAFRIATPLANLKRLLSVLGGTRDVMLLPTRSARSQP